MRRVKEVLAAATDNPFLDEDLQPIAEDAVDRLEAALDGGIEDPPEDLFDAGPIDPPKPGQSRPLDELFEDD